MLKDSLFPDSSCRAEFSFGQCGGGDAFWSFGGGPSFGNAYATALQDGWFQGMPAGMWAGLQDFSQRAEGAFDAARAKDSAQSGPVAVVTTSETFRLKVDEGGSSGAPLVAGLVAVAIAEPTPVGELLLLGGLTVYVVSTAIMSKFDPFASPPGEEWIWKGDAEKGAWHNPDTRESIRPDLNHGPPIGPHVDYRDPEKKRWRIFPDGRKEPKDKK